MILVYTQRLNVKVTLSLGRETKMCTVGMLVWAERAARHVGALYANIPKSFQIHNLRPTCTEGHPSILAMSAAKILINNNNKHVYLVNSSVTKVGEMPRDN